MHPILELIAITLIPGLELRASIPYGLLALEMHWLHVFAVCIIANILLGIIVFLLLDKAVKILTKIKLIDRLYKKYVSKTQKKISTYVDKYGELGVALFIGIPLPGSGSYSGALAAHIIGMKFKKFAIANLIGVLIAGTAVTIIVLTGSELFSFFVKPV